jgi:hypothetical protein
VIAVLGDEDRLQAWQVHRMPFRAALGRVASWGRRRGFDLDVEASLWCSSPYADSKGRSYDVNPWAFDGIKATWWTPVPYRADAGVRRFRNRLAVWTVALMAASASRFPLVAPAAAFDLAGTAALALYSCRGAWWSPSAAGDVHRTRDDAQRRGSASTPIPSCVSMKHSMSSPTPGRPQLARAWLRVAVAEVPCEVQRCGA